MSVTVIEIAHQARRASVIEVVRRMPQLTLEELSQVVDTGPNSEVLRTITLRELQAPRNRAACLREQPEELKNTILQFFRHNPRRVLSSGFFVKRLGLPRWTIAKPLGELVDAGQLERSGRTSSIRYRLAADESSERPRGRANRGAEG